MVTIKINRRGFSYSFLAILFILVAMLFFISDDSTMQEDAFYNSRIIKSLDNKMDSISEDIGRGIYIVGLRSIISIENIIIADVDYIDNLDTTFSEIFINGTYEGSNLLLMQNSSLDNVTNKIENAFLDEGIILDIIPNSATLSQRSPWSITITLNTTILLTDKTNIAKWNTTQLIKKDISIIELNDPVYFIESNGFVHNQIHKTNVTSFVIGNNVDNLITHLKNSFYIESTTAPSYLNRLTGNFSASQNGIESLVNLDDLTDQGITTYNYSTVDYQYFTDKHSDVKVNIPNTLYLDTYHINIYEVTGKTTP